MSGEFSVCQFFPDETYEYVLRYVDAEMAVHTAKRLTESVGARIGTTRRVIITDGGDCCVFEWQHGKGVTFPHLTPIATFMQDVAPALAPNQTE